MAFISTFPSQDETLAERLGRNPRLARRRNQEKEPSEAAYGIDLPGVGVQVWTSVTQPTEQEGRCSASLMLSSSPSRHSLKLDLAPDLETEEEAGAGPDQPTVSEPPEVKLCRCA